MAIKKCTCGYEIDYLPGERNAKLTCPQCGASHYDLEALPGGFGVGGVEAELVWRAGPRRFVVWAAAKLEGDETDRSLALLCCHIAVEIARAIALRKQRTGGSSNFTAKKRSTRQSSGSKEGIREKLRDQFGKLGLDFDNLSFADGLVELERLRHAFVHEGRVVTKSEASEAVKTANAVIAQLEK